VTPVASPVDTSSIRRGRVNGRYFRENGVRVLDDEPAGAQRHLIV
jgi:hypothetical protein